MVRLLKYLKGHTLESILAPLFKMLEAGLDLIVPLIMADVINRGIALGDRDFIIGRCLLMVAIGLAGLACSITAQYFAARAAVRSCASLRRSLFDKIQTLDYLQSDRLGASTLITRMTSDINQVQSGLNLFLRLFLRSPFVVFGSLVMAFTIDVKAASIFALSIPVLAVVVFVIMLATIPMYKRVQSGLDELTGITRENLTGVRVVRAFGREKGEQARFDSSNERFNRRQLSVGRISALMNPLTYVIVNIAIAAILITGATEINAGTLTAGAVIALVNYMSQILIELVKLANLIIQLTRAAACAERVESALSCSPEMQYGTLEADASAAEAVRFDDVGLSYVQGAGESLSDISFVALRGETIGIIGGTGSGKSSLAGLIPRFYDATRGSISIFQKDIRDYSKEAVRSMCIMNTQQARLFSGTVRGNLLWGFPAADDSELWSALSLAKAEDFVRAKPQGLDEPIEQGGRNLSGGQRQRLAIARALLAHAPIIILDDSLSALDYATDAALREGLRTLRDSTVFIVSQRISSVMSADRILVLDDGRLVGNGTHESLLKSCAVYRDIFESQLGASGVRE